MSTHAENVTCQPFPGKLFDVFIAVIGVALRIKATLNPAKKRTDYRNAI
jgi:hypothetical protein